MLINFKLNIFILINNFAFKFLIMWIFYSILIKTVKLFLIFPVKYINKIIYFYKLSWFKLILCTETGIIYW